MNGGPFDGAHTPVTKISTRASCRLRRWDATVVEVSGDPKDQHNNKPRQGRQRAWAWQPSFAPGGAPGEGDVRFPRPDEDYATLTLVLAQTAVREHNVFAENLLPDRCQAASGEQDEIPYM